MLLSLFDNDNDGGTASNDGSIHGLQLQLCCHLSLKGPLDSIVSKASYMHQPRCCPAFVPIAMKGRRVEAMAM